MQHVTPSRPIRGLTLLVHCLLAVLIIAGAPAVPAQAAFMQPAQQVSDAAAEPAAPAAPAWLEFRQQVRHLSFRPCAP